MSSQQQQEQRPSAIAIPSAKEIRQAERQRASVPIAFRPRSATGGSTPTEPPPTGASGPGAPQNVDPLAFVGGGSLGGPGGPSGRGGQAAFTVGPPHPPQQQGQQQQQQQLPRPCPPPHPQHANASQQYWQGPPTGASQQRQPPPAQGGGLRPSQPPGWQQQRPLSGAQFQQQQQLQQTPLASGATTRQQPQQFLQQAPASHQQALPANAIIVNRRQEGNPVLKHIRNVRWQYGDIVPDYLLGKDTACLFLSLRFHMLKPDYIYHRIKELQRSFRLRIVLCHVDTEDAVEPLAQVTRAAIGNDCTLICGWSNQECARYLETFKSYENKPAEVIQKDVGNDYVSRATAALTLVRGVNKTDVKTLGDRFGSAAGLFQASAADLQACPGIGPTKARRLFEAFHEPFRRQLVPAHSPDSGQAQQQQQLQQQQQQPQVPGQAARHGSNEQQHVAAHTATLEDEEEEEDDDFV